MRVHACIHMYEYACAYPSCDKRSVFVNLQAVRMVHISSFINAKIRNSLKYM